MDNGGGLSSASDIPQGYWGILLNLILTVSNPRFTAFDYKFWSNCYCISWRRLSSRAISLAGARFLGHSVCVCGWKPARKVYFKNMNSAIAISNTTPPVQQCYCVSYATNCISSTKETILSWHFVILTRIKQNLAIINHLTNTRRHWRSVLEHVSSRDVSLCQNLSRGVWRNQTRISGTLEERRNRPVFVLCQDCWRAKTWSLVC